MIRAAFYTIIILAISAFLYNIFAELGSIEIYTSNYYITTSPATLFILFVLSLIVFSAIFAIFSYIKNLPSNLMRLRGQYNYKQSVNNSFDIICALESDNKDLALRLIKKDNLNSINHPLAGLLKWKVAQYDKNIAETENEKILLQMSSNEKTLIPAIKELIKNKLKSSELDIASEYIKQIEKLSYRPTWYYRIKFTISLALESWQEANNALDKALKLQIINKDEHAELAAILYTSQAQHYIDHNEPNKAIDLLSKHHKYLETTLLLAELLSSNNDNKNASYYLIANWNVEPNYKLLNAWLEIHADLTTNKAFEQLEKLFVAESDRAYLILTHKALELGLYKAAKKYLNLVEDKTSSHAVLLQFFYDLNTEEALNLKESLSLFGNAYL